MLNTLTINAMQAQIERNDLARFYPTEDKFLKEWFQAILHGYTCHGHTELSSFRNYEINYEFEQPREYVNRVIFHEGGTHVTLIAQKITVEYMASRGIFSRHPTIRIIKRKRTRKTFMIHG